MTSHAHGYLGLSYCWLCATVFYKHGQQAVCVVITSYGVLSLDVPSSVSDYDFAVAFARRGYL